MLLLLRHPRSDLTGPTCRQPAPPRCRYQSPAAQAPGPEASSPAPQAAAQGAAPLRVMVGKSLLINTTERLKRVSVTDPTPWPTPGGHADADSGARTRSGRSFPADLGRTGALAQLRPCASTWTSARPRKKNIAIFPDEQITVTPSRSAIVLSGHVSTEDVSKRAGMIAEAYSKNVVNVLTFGPVGAQEVLLEVKFAEVDRSAVTQLGVNFFSGGGKYASGTDRLGTIRRRSRYPADSNHRTANGMTTTSTNDQRPHQRSLNLFLFRPDINFGAVIQGPAAEEPAADSGGAEPDRGERQGSQLSGGRRVSLPGGSARPGLYRGDDSVQGVWRAG